MGLGRSRQVQRILRRENYSDFVFSAKWYKKILSTYINITQFVHRHTFHWLEKLEEFGMSFPKPENLERIDGFATSQMNI